MAQQGLLGSISGLFRFPVKSLQGEVLNKADVKPNGIAGDRIWAFRDVERDEITNGKRSPLLMQVAAALTADPAPRARLSLPGGESFYTDAADCNTRVSDFVGRQLVLNDVRPATDKAHYARAKMPPEQFEATIREMLGLLPGEPMPDFSKLPPEALANATLPGTYFDASAISIVLASELRKLHDSLPDAGVDVMRFRPNIILDDLANPLSSESLVGARLKVGETEMIIDSHAPRCSMTTHAQDRLPKAPQIMRTLVRDWQQKFGLYVSVLKGGQIRIGDPIARL